MFVNCAVSLEPFYIKAHMDCISVGELSAVTGVHSMFGIGAGSILLPPVQTSALGMPLLQGPDGAINLLNNIQVGTWNVAWGIKYIKRLPAKHGHLL